MSAIPDPLTNRQKNLCEYGGLFGVLLSVTCLVQHFILAIPNKITNPMIPVYIFAIVTFILMALQKAFSLILLIITAALLAIVEYEFTTHYAFSLVVLLLFLYSVIIIVTLLAEQIPQKLKQKQKAKKAEESFWEGKL
jgi:hypothetical protein